MSRMITQSLNEIVDDVKSMNGRDAEQFLKGGNYVRIMKETPSVILDHVADANNHPIIMRTDAFYLATRRAGVQPGHYHGLGDIMKQLPELLSDPEAILMMDSGRLNILAELPREKKSNGIISVELNTVKDIHNSYNPYNLILTLFGSNDAYVKNAVRKHAVSVQYMKEDLPQVNRQLHDCLAIINGKSSTTSISREAAESQAKLSEIKMSIKPEYDVDEAFHPPGKTPSGAYRVHAARVQPIGATRSVKSICASSHLRSGSIFSQCSP